MNSEQLFALALGLNNPWHIKEIRLDKDDKLSGELHIYLDFTKGSLFKDSFGNYCKVYDSRERTWQHMNFFQHKCFIHARVPRITNSEGKPITLQVPWARPDSGFTLLFEAYSMLLIESEMPVNKVARVVDVYPQRLWTVFNYWVNKAHKQDDISKVVNVGFDETSKKKGHDYVTIAVDLDQRRVLLATEGKGADCIEKTAEYFESKEVKRSQIEQICIDMSPAFISGCKASFKNAAVTFDKFHVVKEVNKAMDEIRKQERKQASILKGCKYWFLMNPKKLSHKNTEKKDEIMELYPSLGEGYRLKELFADLWDLDTKEEAEAFLSFWCDQVEDSGIESFINVTKTIKNHWQGIINYIDSKINNGILEGINSQIQLAKKRARGYRNFKNLINMIYFTLGKLKFDYPQYIT